MDETSNGWKLKTKPAGEDWSAETHRPKDMYTFRNLNIFFSEDPWKRWHIPYLKDSKISAGEATNSDSDSSKILPVGQVMLQSRKVIETSFSSPSKSLRSSFLPATRNSMDGHWTPHRRV